MTTASKHIEVLQYVLDSDPLVAQEKLEQAYKAIGYLEQLQAAVEKAYAYITIAEHVSERERAVAILEAKEHLKPFVETE